MMPANVYEPTIGLVDLDLMLAVVRQRQNEIVDLVLNKANSNVV